MRAICQTLACLMLASISSQCSRARHADNPASPNPSRPVAAPSDAWTLSNRRMKNFSGAAFLAQARFRAHLSRLSEQEFERLAQDAEHKWGREIRFYIDTKRMRRKLIVGAELVPWAPGDSPRQMGSGPVGNLFVVTDPSGRSVPSVFSGNADTLDLGLLQAEIVAIRDRLAEDLGDLALERH